MDYYKRKQLASQTVKELLGKGTNVLIIQEVILENYGFDKKFVNERIQSLNQLQELLEKGAA